MNVLICPLSDPGYLYPGIAVGIELRGRHHHICVLGRSSAAPAVAAAGLLLIPEDSYGERNAFSAREWFWRTPQQYRAILRAAREVRADVLVTSALCLGALLAAEVLDLPVVVLGFAAHLWDYQAGADGEPARPADRAWRTRELIRRYEQARDRVGLPKRADCASTCPLTGTALLLRGDPALEYPGAVLPRRVHHVGPCAWEPAADPAELKEITTSLYRAGKPVVYVHLGRVFGGTTPWPWLNVTFTGGPFQAVVEQGRSDDPQPDPRADILLVRKPWMGPLIDRAGLVLTSGTSAPVLSALLRGRPLGVSPAGSEQPLLAAACVRAGVAVYIGNEHTTDPAAVLRRAWQAHSLRRRAGELGSKLAAAGSSRRAATFIEAAVSGSPR